jgi:hypothetical protein
MAMKGAKVRKKQAVRLNITVPADLLEESRSLARHYRFEGISDLVHHFMRLMLANGSPHFPIHSGSQSGPTSAFRIDAFKKLQDQLQLTPEKAAEWTATIKDARR